MSRWAEDQKKPKSTMLAVILFVVGGGGVVEAELGDLEPECACI